MYNKSHRNKYLSLDCPL